MCVQSIAPTTPGNALIFLKANCVLESVVGIPLLVGANCAKAFATLAFATRWIDLGHANHPHHLET